MPSVLSRSSGNGAELFVHGSGRVNWWHAFAGLLPGTGFDWVDQPKKCLGVFSVARHPHIGLACGTVW